MSLLRQCLVHAVPGFPGKMLLNWLIVVSDMVMWGTGIRGLMRGMATFPPGNQELLLVKDKDGRPPGELGVSKSIECDIISFTALI